MPSLVVITLLLILPCYHSARHVSILSCLRFIYFLKSTWYTLHFWLSISQSILHRVSCSGVLQVALVRIYLAECRDTKDSTWINQRRSRTTSTWIRDTYFMVRFGRRDIAHAVSFIDTYCKWKKLQAIGGLICLEKVICSKIGSKANTVRESSAKQVWFKGKPRGHLLMSCIFS